MIHSANVRSLSFWSVPQKSTRSSTIYVILSTRIVIG